MILIKAFKTANQKEIDIMIMEISIEYKIPISSNNISVNTIFLDQYWVAFNGNEIIGTISLLVIRIGVHIDLRMKKQERSFSF